MERSHVQVGLGRPKNNPHLICERVHTVSQGLRHELAVRIHSWFARAADHWSMLEASRRNSLAISAPLEKYVQGSV
jgi:hypothetical protein